MKRFYFFAIAILAIINIVMASIFFISVPSTSKGETFIEPLNGVSVANISLQSFKTNFPNTPVGLMKSDGVLDLVDNEYFASMHSIPLFSPVNLFTFSLSSTHELDVNDLKSYYSNLPTNDIQEREKVASVIASLYYEGNEVKKYSLPSGPEVVITYKEESTKHGIVRIPERHIVDKHEIVTYFLIDPLKVVSGERLSYFDIAQVYDMEPCFFNTLLERKKLDDPNLDFSGFVVDIPSNGIDKSYMEALNKTLEKLSNLIHSKNKLLIVENLTEASLSLGKYGDIIGISASEAYDPIFKDARIAFNNKQIFVTFNGAFPTNDALKLFLENCAFYGVYPEFRRDTSTGEFFYYEKSFANTIDLVNERLTQIRQLNKAKFKEIFNAGNFEVAKYGEYPFTFYCLRGNPIISFPLGNCTIIIPKTSINDSAFFIFDSLGHTVKTEQSADGYNVSLPVDGFEILRVLPQEFCPLYIGYWPSPSNGREWHLSFINAGAKEGSETITIEANGKISTFALDFTSLEEKAVTLDVLPAHVSFGNLSFNINGIKGNINYSLIAIILTLAAFIFIALKKEFHFRKLLREKAFDLISILSTLVLIAANRIFIHYSTVVMTYMLFSFIYLLMSLSKSDGSINKDSEYKGAKRSILAGLFMLLVGLIYSYSEFGTLLPSTFSGLLPIQLYEQFIFCFPFIFAAFFFFTWSPSNISKVELLIIFTSLLTVLFFFDSVSLVYLWQANLSSLAPIIVIFVGIFLADLLSRNINLKNALFFVLALVFILVTPYVSKFYYSHIFNLSTFVLLLKDFYLLLAPILFITLRERGSKKNNPDISLNLLVLTLLLLVLSYFLLTQFTLGRAGNPFFMQIGYISVPVILSLFLLLFIEPIYIK